MVLLEVVSWFGVRYWCCFLEQGKEKMEVGTSSKKRKSGKEPRGSSSQTPQNVEPPPPLPPTKFSNRNHKANFDALQPRKLLPTKHYNQTITTKLGIDEQCWFFFNNLGLTDFVSKPYNTYREPTLEFLASFEKHTSGNNNISVSFQLFNKKETMSLHKFTDPTTPADGGSISPETTTLMQSILWLVKSCTPP